MAVPVSFLENPQQVEVVVTSPDGANRMFVHTGIAVVNFVSTPGATIATSETFTFFLEPAFSPGQFRRAIANASLAGYFLATQNITQILGATLEVTSADADWDDESGRVEVRINARVGATQGGDVRITRFAYHVTVLAAV